MSDLSPFTAFSDGADYFIRGQGWIHLHLSHVQWRTVDRPNDELLAIDSLDPHFTLSTSLFQQFRQLLLGFSSGKSRHGFTSRTGTCAARAAAARPLSSVRISPPDST